MTKYVVITGASGSIGVALTKAFQQNAYKVIGLDRQAGGSADFFEVVDLNELVENPAVLKDLLTKIKGIVQNGQLHALVNNAAEQLLNPTEQLSLTQWQRTMNVNLTAPFLLSQGLLPLLQTAKGSIVNIASIHQTLTKPQFVAYATSKTALVGLTQSMAVDLAGKIRVNAISPAAIETPMLKAGFPNENDYQQLNKIHPVGRIGQPEEVAALALFLCSAQAGFINGANMAIDGGISHVLKDL
jgi:NAD(P)-dependent dehydrogenase (short-subunit alcohol dehydrogenase family)